VKGTCAGYKVIILFVTFAAASFASPDPFMGEGKQGYIKRCISTSEMPEHSSAEREAFCRCFANKLESGYEDVLKSISPNDSVALAQEKMNSMAQQFARACMP
jgi:hypothetical protein